MKNFFDSKFFKTMLVAIAACLVAVWVSDAEKEDARTFFKVLFDNAEPIAVVSAAALFFLESPDRQRREEYDAWQIINSAKGQTGSGGRIQALESLNKHGVELDGVAVSGADLSEINLSHAVLRRANFEAAQLDSANFEAANLQGACFKEADLWNANLKGANLRNANLEGADLEFANLEGADLEFANLEGADLRSANCERTILRKATLEGTKLSKVNLKGSVLRGTILEGIDLLIEGSEFEDYSVDRSADTTYRFISHLSHNEWSLVHKNSWLRTIVQLLPFSSVDTLKKEEQKIAFASSQTELLEKYVIAQQERIEELQKCIVTLIDSSENASFNSINIIQTIQDSLSKPHLRTFQKEQKVLKAEVFSRWPLKVLMIIPKTIISNRREILKHINRLNQNLKDELRKIEQDENEILKVIRDLIDEDVISSLSAADNLRLKKVIDLIDDHNLLKSEIEDYIQAANWLEKRKSGFANRLSRQAAIKYQRFVPIRKIKEFEHDVECYFDWVCESLRNAHPDLEISKFVENPAVPYLDPYNTVIDDLIDLEKWDEITPNQGLCLEKMLHELVYCLENYFRKDSAWSRITTKNNV